MALSLACRTCIEKGDDQWDALDAIEEVRHSNLSKKFSNGTSTIDIDNGYVDDSDSDSDDEAKSYLPKDAFADNVKLFDQDAFTGGVKLFDQDSFAGDAKLFD
ncbi:hypothetical protein Fot_32094 [Forsythia ovata]|uniref:Uncharacterized protein n=1 Tax=Forsythia ovata TaxID=205694 RepID=A0ABD1T6V6_9LAMI